MSEEPKKTNKYVTKYEQIYQKLEKVTKVYLKSKSTQHFEHFITSERGINKTGLSNLLIEIPEENIIEIIKKQYINETNNEGELGTIEPEKQVYEIRNIALLMLMSNRLSKDYKNRLEKNQTLDEVTKTKYTKNEKDLLIWKHTATSDLIASLYILEKTGGEEYKDFFSYGESKDEENKSTFIIDLPYIGQISVHFGPNKLNIIEEARSKAMYILERKRALGQINKNELKRLREELNVSKILPKYEGKLYEYTSALPIEYIGPTAKSKVQEIGLDSKLPEEIKKEDIQKMAEIGLNEREAYYLGIKLGCTKKQLKEVIKTYNNREKLNQNTNSNRVITFNRSTTQGENSERSEEKLPIEKKVGRKAIIMSTATQRAAVVQFENRNLQNYKANQNGKVMEG